MTYCMFMGTLNTHSLTHSITVDESRIACDTKCLAPDVTKGIMRIAALLTSRRFTVFRVQFSVERLGDGATLGDGRRENGDLTAKHAAAAVDE